MSSLSTNARNSPVAASMPVLRAALRPPLGWARSRKRGSRAAKASAIAALPSVDPSSTITTSRSPNVCVGDRLEARLEVALDVVDRDDDADARHGGDPRSGRKRRRARLTARRWRLGTRRSTRTRRDAGGGGAGLRAWPLRRLAAVTEDWAIASASPYSVAVARPRGVECALGRGHVRVGVGEGLRARSTPRRPGRARARARRTRPTPCGCGAATGRRTHRPAPPGRRRDRSAGPARARDRPASTSGRQLASRSS